MREPEKYEIPLTHEHGLIDVVTALVEKGELGYRVRVWQNERVFRGGRHLRAQGDKNAGGKRHGKHDSDDEIFRVHAILGLVSEAAILQAEAALR